jgi:dihydrofolate reductase
MANVQLYIAQSLDGFIADAQGGVEWLERAGGEEDYGYEDFMGGVGAVVMGATTYEQAMSWDIPWPYHAVPTWVVTHRRLATPQGADVRFAEGPVGLVMSEIEEAVEGNVWLVGGASLVRQFLEARLIDELMLFVAPLTIGEGIPLFQNVPPTDFKLAGTREFKTGLVELRYSLRPEA